MMNKKITYQFHNQCLSYLYSWTRIKVGPGPGPEPGPGPGPGQRLGPRQV